MSRAALTLLFAAACGGAVAENPEPNRSSPLVAGPRAQAEVGSVEPWLERSCARVGTEPLAAEDARREGSAIALGRSRDRLMAFAADHDQKSVAVVDVAAAERIADVPVLGTPEQVLILRDGRVLVTVADGAHVEVFEPTQGARSLERLCARRVAAGPFGAALSEDGTKVAIASAWNPTLTVLTTEAMQPAFEQSLSRSPRGVTIEGKTAFVTHLAGTVVSAVDISGSATPVNVIRVGVTVASQVVQRDDAGFIRRGSQAFALASINVPRPGPQAKGEPERQSRVVIPMITVDPGDPSRSTRLYYGPPPTAGVDKQSPIGIVIDPITQRSLSQRVVAVREQKPSGSCLLPRAVAYRETTQRLYVACMGLDTVLELDANAADPMRAEFARFDVPKGPIGIAVSERAGLAVVLSQFDSKVAILDLSGGSSRFVDLSEPTTHASLRVGRELFYRTNDAAITAEGLACASCHPDGMDDGITWSTPEGLRQTPMLAGRLSRTHPYGWNRGQRTVTSYIADTCQRLGGKGLQEGELEALSAYVTSIPLPPAAAVDSPFVLAGREAFFKRGCGGCHVNGNETDRQMHAFGERAFDTPSLARVGATAPYFHDGRYVTLEGLLASGADGMGETHALTPEEIRSISAYLRSL